MNYHQKMGILALKKRKSRQKQFRDKTAYVWGLRYRWDPSLSMNPVRWFAHFMPPCFALFSRFFLFRKSSFWKVTNGEVKNVNFKKLFQKWKPVSFKSSPKISIYSWCTMFSSRSDQGIPPKQFSQIKFTIIQTTQPMSRYPTRKTIVFLAAIACINALGSGSCLFVRSFVNMQKNLKIALF